MANGLLDFLTADYATRQQRTRDLNDRLDGLLDYYLGPTGIPDRLRSLNALLNPIDQIGEAGANTVVAFDPTRSRQDRIEAALNAGLGTITAAAPAVGGAIAGQPARRALMETLIGASDQVDDAAARLAADIQARGGALAADATGLGRGLLARDPEMIGEVFQPSGTARGLSADAVDTSYRMAHQPRGPFDENPVRLDDLTISTTGETAGYPRDFYSTQGQRIYAPGPQFKGDDFGQSNQESYKAILAARNNPDAKVTIYRAVPDDPSITTINDGDFVTLSPTYAKLHGASGYGRSGDEAGKILSQEVSVKDIYWDGNDVNEFGFFPTQPVTLPAPRNEAEVMARQILEMRAAGRASEVTDEMMAQADPQYMFKNTPLPMDEASRMARAGEMGFDTGNSLTHGSKRDFSAFSTDAEQSTDFGWYGQGVSLAPNNPSMSDAYAMAEKEGMGQWGGRTYPVTSRGRMYEWPEANPPLTSREQSVDVTNALRGIGYEGSNIYAPNNPDVWGQDAGRWWEQVIYDPRNIRSRFARFDPEFRHLRNLNAALGGLAVGGGLLNQYQDDQLRRRLGLLEN